MRVSVHEKKAPRPAWAKRLFSERYRIEPNQTKFAESLGWSQPRYSTYETGIREPNIAAWKVLQKRLGEGVYFVITGDRLNGITPPSRPSRTTLKLVGRPPQATT